MSNFINKVANSFCFLGSCSLNIDLYCISFAFYSQEMCYQEMVLTHSPIALPFSLVFLWKRLRSSPMANQLVWKIEWKIKLTGYQFRNSYTLLSYLMMPSTPIPCAIFALVSSGFCCLLCEPEDRWQRGSFLIKAIEIKEPHSSQVSLWFHSWG